MVSGFLKKCHNMRHTTVQHNTKPGAFNIFILIFTKSCKLKTSLLMCSPMRKPRFREFHRPACCGTVAHQHSEQSGSTLAVGCGNHILFLELFSLRHPDLDSGKKLRCSLWGDRTMIYPTWILIVKALHHIFGNLET